MLTTGSVEWVEGVSVLRDLREGMAVRLTYVGGEHLNSSVNEGICSP